MQCQLYEPIQIKLAIKYNFKLYKVNKSILQTHILLMSKQKQLRRIVLDKLYVKKKNQTIYLNLKKSTRSNAPTQSTPNEPKNKNMEIQNFFQNFQSQCAIIYQPVVFTNKKPLKRALQSQLLQLQKFSKLKTQTFCQQQKMTAKKISKLKKNQVNSKENCKVRLNTQCFEKSSSTNNSFFEFNKKDKTNCNSLIKNKSTLIKKIPSQFSTFGSKLYENKSTVITSTSISKYASPTSKIRSFNRGFSKKIITNQHEFIKKPEDSIHNERKVDYQLKNAPKKPHAFDNLNNVQKIKRVQSLRQFNNGIKKSR